MRNQWIAATSFLLLLPGSLPAQGRGRIVEEIVARVNNDIITLSEYQKAQAALQQEVAQDCPGCPQDQILAMYRDRQKDVLRDLIDQSLLVQHAKDLGLNVETEMVKRLDQVRQSNNLASMEELEKAVEAQGTSWEEYKSNLRNNLLTQEVIRREAGSRINIGSDEVKKYYEEHKSGFNRPEEVFLGEILFRTAGKKPEEIPAIRKKAEDILERIKKGEDFEELARRYSEGQTAKQGGGLGAFERGQLSKQIEAVVFKMNKGDVTDVIQTNAGFEVFKAFEHYEAGLQPINKVENEIMNKLYMEKIQPSLREYLGELREQSYVVVKPGYTDSAGIADNRGIEEVAPTPDSGSRKKHKKAKRSGL